jgi:hypothetical protein
MLYILESICESINNDRPRAAPIPRGKNRVFGKAGDCGGVKQRESMERERTERAYHEKGYSQLTEKTYQVKRPERE